MSDAFQVIARRWRPQQFDEIVGQEHIVRTLKNAIETGRIGHAYLFVGPRGTGKTTTARIFAKALNCTDGPSINPPEDDPLCKAIVEGSCMDVVEIDAATNRSIEDAKKIREECYFVPAQCRFKIYIIDEVHQLTRDAFNALLKVIEEPPPHVKFIFATTEAEKVLDTITSRCQRFEFQPIPEEKIVARLQQITKTDGIDADDDALFAIARLANGGMRDSQSILDQVISFCGKKISEKDVLDIYGLASNEQIEGLAAAMAATDYASIVKFADTFVSEGRDLLRVLRYTQARIREALLESIREKGVGTMLGTPMRTEQLLRMLDALQLGENNVKFGLSERANFEVCLLKATEQSRTRAIDSLIKDIAGLAAGMPADESKKKDDNSLIQKFREANLEAKKAQQLEDARFTKSVPSSPISSSPKKADLIPTQNLNEDLPYEDRSNTEPPAVAENLAEAKISDEEIVAAVPTLIRDAVRETFGTEFQASQKNTDIFSPNDTDKVERIVEYDEEEEIIDDIIEEN